MSIQFYLPITGILEREIKPSQTISFDHWPPPPPKRSRSARKRARRLARSQQLSLSFFIRNSNARYKFFLFKNRSRAACCYCGKSLSLKEATLEHILQKSKGGSNKIENLTISCAPCNNERQDYTFDQWKKIIELKLNKTPYIRLYRHLVKTGRLVDKKYLR